MVGDKGIDDLWVIRYCFVFVFLARYIFEMSCFIKLVSSHNYHIIKKMK